MPRNRAVDMLGKQFGFLTVVRRAPNEKKHVRPGGVFACWVCRCSCGEEVIVRGQNLRQGRRKACAVKGHFWRSLTRGGLTTKFKSEYASWVAMRGRCQNSKARSYENYGGRGIKVCEQWDTSFAQFLRDMGPKPAGKYSIDRYPDMNGNYEPTNCRWATDSEQRRNARDNIYVEYEGEHMLLVVLMERLGLSYPLIKGRLQKGWSLADALVLPARKKLANGKCKKHKSGKKPVVARVTVIQTPWNIE